MCYYNKQLFKMDDSSYTNTSVDKLSATFVNVVVVDLQDAPAVAAPTHNVTGLQLDASLDNASPTNNVPLQVKPNQY